MRGNCQEKQTSCFPIKKKKTARKDCPVQSTCSTAATSLLTAANTSLVSPLGRPARPSNTHAEHWSSSAGIAEDSRWIPDPSGTCPLLWFQSWQQNSFFSRSGLCYTAALFSSRLGDETISDHSVGKTHPCPVWGKRCDKLMRYSPSLFPIASHASTQAVKC